MRSGASQLLANAHVNSSPPPPSYYHGLHEHAMCVVVHSYLKSVHSDAMANPVGSRTSYRRQIWSARGPHPESGTHVHSRETTSHLTSHRICQKLDPWASNVDNKNGAELLDCCGSHLRLDVKGSS